MGRLTQRPLVLGEEHPSKTGFWIATGPEAGPGIISVLILRQQQTNFLGKEGVQLFLKFLSIYTYTHIYKNNPVQQPKQMQLLQRDSQNQFPLRARPLICM